MVLEEEDNNVLKLPETLLDWYYKQLRESNISAPMADFAGILLHTQDPLGIQFQYFDRQGDAIPDYVRYRVRDTNIPFSASYGERIQGRSKYLQAKGLGQRLYWPRFVGVNHALNVSDVSCPLYIVEGEKKALCLQSTLAKLGIQGSVLGVPGVKLGKAIFKELSSILYVSGESRRKVTVAFDWNNPDSEGELETRTAEKRLVSHMRDQGAEPSILRWPITPEEIKEQKVDDWLVAGGDLLAAEEFSKELDPEISDISLKLHEFNNLYAVYAGKIVLLNSPHVELTGSQFRLQTADEYVWDETSKKPKRIYIADLWLTWKQRTAIAGRIFAPPALGTPRERIIKDKVNISPNWPEHYGSPFEEYDFSLFDWLLRRFCESEEQFLWLRKHLAHAARSPQEGTSNACVFADDGGTGKGFLFRTIRKLFGSFVVEIKDELTGRFNDTLAGKLIGLYDEPDYDRSENINIDKSTKRIVGNPYLSVEGKGLRTYTVENYLRLIVSMNLKFVAKINHHDRRWNYFTSAPKMTPEESTRYAEWLNGPQSGPALERWVQSVDLEGYDSNILGPVSDGRRSAIKHAASVYEQFLEWEGLLERDVWSSAELCIMFTNFAPGYRRLNPVALGIQLGTLLGEDSVRITKIAGKAQRLRVVRNVGTWRIKSPEEWIKEHNRGR